MRISDGPVPINDPNHRTPKGRRIKKSHQDEFGREPKISLHKKESGTKKKNDSPHVESDRSKNYAARRYF